ncbi:MAG: class I SAM-dependent methyltransferase [Candidatus Pacebacteria bacterium]|nr:class I SAM-dependent methyltransferase [Candidatus Paceibacterota bacterium]
MTLLRKAEHRALSRITLSGKVLDLGGDARSSYALTLAAEARVVTVNISTATGADIVANLEEPLPIPNDSYDHVLLMNVLEHVFEYRLLLDECARVLRPGGSIVIIVPYLFPYHASPSDFHRYSAEALNRALSSAGFTTVEIEPLGSGVFSARWLMLERLLPGRVQDFIAPGTHALASLADAVFTSLAHTLRKKYNPADYALGFCAVAKL